MSVFFDIWVYLRVGGGAIMTPFYYSMELGLSPRGRRSRFPRKPEIPVPGSISAWAEEPYVVNNCLLTFRVYLRVGGGARTLFEMPRTTEGLSPRGRRSQCVYLFITISLGSISAWAEEPL